MTGVKVEFVVLGRIGAKGEKARPIRIKIDDVGHRRNLLARAKGLKEIDGLERVFIVPDLTRAQQEEGRKLREEVSALRREGKFRIRISKGEIVKEPFASSRVRIEGGDVGAEIRV
jgi:hypothetical protein